MTSPDAADAFVQWWLTARRTVHLLDRQAEAAVSEATGLTLTQFAVLKTLDTEDECLNQQDLADQLDLTKSTISRQIDILLEAGLVAPAPNPRSRRERLLQLSPTGERTVRTADDAVCAAQRDLAATFTADELGDAVALTARLARMLFGVAPTDPTPAP